MQGFPDSLLCPQRHFGGALPGAGGVHEDGAVELLDDALNLLLSLPSLLCPRLFLNLDLSLFVHYTNFLHDCQTPVPKFNMCSIS